MTKDTRAGLSINHMVLGDGNERALMMHCTLSSARAMAPMAMALEQRFTTTALTFLAMVSGDWDFNGDLGSCHRSRRKLYRRPDPFDWALARLLRCV